jgi:VIT1/CCC1 family predicted Fe2+/Mn2+ transporter
MPQTPHVERHFTAGETVRDIVIGMSDGLTVPFALAAGLSGAVSDTHIVVTAGLAEVAAGSIAMGLGGYLAARGDAEHFASERVREEREIVEMPDAEMAEVAAVFTGYGVSEAESAPLVRAPRADHRRRLHRRGLIPLSPYFLFAPAHTALQVSVVVTLIALLIFGYVKGHFTGTSPVRSALQTAIIGGLAATAAFPIARAST